MRVAAWVAAVTMIAIVVVGLVLAHTISDSGRLARWLEGRLNTALAGQFTVKDAAYGFPNRIVVRGFAVRSPSGQELLRVDSVSATVELTRLLGDTIGIDDIEVTGVALVLADEGEGEIGLVRAFSPREPVSAGGSDPGWSVDAAIDFVREGNVTLTLAGSGARLRDLSLAASRVRVNGGAVRVETAGEIQSLEGTLGDRPLEARVGLGALSLEIVDGTTSVVAREVVLQSEGSRVNAELELRTAGAMANTSLELDVATEILLEHPIVRELVRSHWRGPPVEGELRGRVSGSFVGATGRVEAELEIEPDLLMVAGLPVGACRMEVGFQDGALVLSTSRVTLGGGVVTASGTVELVGDRIGHELQATLDRFPLRGLLVDPPAIVPELVSGRLSATGTDLRSLSTRVTGELSFPGYSLVAAPEPRIATLSFSGRVAGEQVLDATVGWRDGGVQVDARGSADFAPRGTLAIDIEVAHGDPGATLRQLVPGASAAAVRFAGRAEGTWENPGVRGTAWVRELRVPQAGPIDIEIPLTLADGLLSVRDGTLETPGGTVGVDGTWMLRDKDAWSKDGEIALALAGKGVSVAELVPGGDPRATVDFAGSVTGELSAPSYTVHVEATDGSLRGVGFHSLRLEGSGDLSTVTLSSLELRLARGGVVRVEGNAQIDGSSVDGHVEVDALPVGAAEALAGIDTGASGMARLRCAVSGSLAQPRIDGSIQITDATWREIGFGIVDVTVAGDLDAAAVTATVAGPLGRADARGHLAWREQTANGRLRLVIEELGRLAGAVPDLVMSGRANLEVTFTGPLAAPEVVGSVVVEDAALAGQSLGRMEAELATLDVPRERSYALHARLARPVPIGATATLTPDPLGLEVVATFGGLSSRGFVPDLDAAGVEAVLSGAGTLRWSPRAGWDAEVRLRELAVVLPADRMRLERAAAVRISPGRIAVDDLRLVGEHTHVEVRGVVSDAIDLAAQGTVDMALVTPFLSAITRASGTVVFELRATGSIDAPTLRGAAQPRGPVSVRLRGVRDEIVLEKGRIALAPDALTVEALEARFGEGRITARGRVGLVELRPAGYDVELDFDGLVVNTGELSLEADGAVSLYGVGRVPSLRGRVQIVRGRFRRGFELRDLAFVAKPAPPGKATAPPPEWLPEMMLDLTAASAEPFEVEVFAGPLRVRALMGAELTVRGNAAVPVLEGRITAESGSIRFPAAELELVETTIDFEPSVDLLAAAIHVRAEGEIAPRGQPETYFTDLRLDGDLNRLALEVNTDPPLDRTEALVLLATGMLSPGRGTPGSQGGELDAALTVASAQLASPLTAALSDQIENLFNFRPELGAAASTTELEVSASQRITGRLRLEGVYRRAYDGSVSLTTARARMLLSDKLFIEGTARSATVESSAAELGPQNQVELKYRLIGD